MLTNTPPMEGQQVQIKLYDGDWQDAVYRDGSFIDHYGLPLDEAKIAQWRPAVINGAAPAHRAQGDAAKRFAAVLH